MLLGLKRGYVLLGAKAFHSGIERWRSVFHESLFDNTLSAYFSYKSYEIQLYFKGNSHSRKHWPFLSSPDCKVYGKWNSPAGLHADCHKTQRGCSEMCEIYAHHPRTEIKHGKKKRMKALFQREKQPGTNKLPLGFKSWTSNSLQMKIQERAFYNEHVYVTQPLSLLLNCA